MRRKLLNSIGVSRSHPTTRTDKIEQLKDAPSWRGAKANLKNLRRTGLLTLQNATKNRLVLQWEPRVFPGEAIKAEAQRTLEVVKHDLTLAFKSQSDREKFMRWLRKSGLLSE